MFSNYLKVAMRLIRSNKLISAINVLGLALALTGCLLITLFVKDELSYDRFNKKADHIYRVTRNFLSPDGSVALHLGPIAPPFGPLLKNDFADITDMARTRRFYGGVHLINDDGSFKENLDIENPYFAEPSIFNIFTIPILSGDSTNALVHPNTLMVSEATAKKFFGTTDVVGKLVGWEGRTIEVTGVFKTFPAQSHWHPDALFAFSTLNDPDIYGRERLETNYGNNNFSTYILVNDQFDPTRTEAQFPDFLDRHMREPDNPTLPSTWTHLFLQPLTSIHLHSQLDYEIEANGNINHIYIMSAIGVFLMLIACFNFINLSTGRAITRSKEVGLRKVVGAAKGQLVGQYLTESVLIAFFALVLAIVFVILSLGWLNEFTGKSIRIMDYVTVPNLLLIMAVIIFIGILAGIYPAFVISGFRPAMALGGKSGRTRGSGQVRKLLVVVQFAISITMIIATLITYRQLNYLNNEELGYAKDQIVTLDYNDDIDNNFETFYHELTDDPSVMNATRSSLVPTGRLLDYQGSAVMKGDSVVNTDIAIKDVRVDETFLPTYNIPLVSGRNFSKDIKSDDSLAFILNEAAVKMIGWSNEEAVGQMLQNGDTRGTVIGVIKDFHFESLHEPIVPLVLHEQHYFNQISVQIDQSKTKEALAHIEKVWDQFLPEQPFHYRFLSERYEHLYDSEQRQNELFMIFAGLTIFIAAMGLFGLATFSTLQRSREVSIRKVLGASVSSILQLLSKEIMVLILIANIISWPVAWYFMNRWLSGFAYHVSMPLFTYVLATVVALLITLITIGSQTIKTAMTNPASVLRSE